MKDREIQRLSAMFNPLGVISKVGVFPKSALLSTENHPTLIFKINLKQWGGIVFSVRTQTDRQRDIVLFCIIYISCLISYFRYPKVVTRQTWQP